MSAAAPLPYDHGGAPPPLNRNANGDGGFNGTDKPYQHIRDLQTLAHQGYSPEWSIFSLLDAAEKGLNQADTWLDYRRPDMAFVEFVRASDIVIEVVPHHKDYTHFTLDQPELASRLDLLKRRIHSEWEQYTNIKQIIVHNNHRNAMRPASEANGASLDVHPAHQKIKPSPSPKPEKLHGQPISSATAGPGTNGSQASDPLNERFAKLRMSALDTRHQERLDSRASNASSTHTSPISRVPSAGDYASRAPFESNLALNNPANSTSMRVQGPRGMPDGNLGPAVPAKLALSTQNIAMPKEPEATYSPARNMETTGNIAPPRHSARSLASNSNRRSSLLPASSASAQVPNGFSTSGDYFPPTNGLRLIREPRRKSSAGGAPPELRMGAERLLDYLRRYNILLIDFRPREAFDEGHINHRSVMCIDPLSAREGMSAEQLYESLVLSPDLEIEMFINRDQYDLVVYYDKDTQSETFLTSPVTESQRRLKYLHEALDEFNTEKPLHRPPFLLIGGIEAWSDLIGRQALMSSNTLARGKQGGQGIKRRPLARARAVNGGRNPRMTKRRLTEYNPLDAEEERSWRERARVESVVLPPTPALGPEEAQEDEGEAGDDESNAAIQEFLERFPDAHNLDQRAFAVVAPTRPPPEPPTKVPLYPSPPSPPNYPSYTASPEEAYPPGIPARPVPAAPRMSYTGVSHRAVSATTPATRTTSTQMVPYIPPKYLQTNIRLPKTGLVNFGNTCYMNSTLQALSATTPLSIFFLDDAYRTQLQRDNWKVNSKGVLAELYSNLIRNLWKGDVDSLRPTTFRRFCGRLSEFWKSDSEQQDAKEFLDFLLDGLHEDLNTTWKGSPLRALTEQEEATREKMSKLVVAKLEWGRYTHRDLSFVNSLFGGQHLSRLQCRTCGFTSTTYEAFTSISVEIPTDPRQYSNGGRLPTLQDCLRSYCTEEYLTKDDQWHCPRCKTTREASKRITLTRAPPYLVIHLKRFSTANHGASARKVRVPVDFPLHHLDLGPYMLPPPSAGEAKQILTEHGAEALKSDASMTPPYLYDAYAVIRHIGSTMQAGHYVTAVETRQGLWRMFNDTRVADFNPENLPRDRGLQNEEAYIVFYQRVPARADGKI